MESRQDPQTRPCDPRVRPHLVCPRCRGELEDLPGALRCAACAVRWPVVYGIPHMIEEEVLPDADHSTNMGGP